MQNRHKKLANILLPAALMTAVLLLWEWYVRHFGVPLYILPKPSQIFETLVLERTVLFSNSLVTVGETLLGLLIAVVAGMLLAVVMDALPMFKTAIYPLLVVSQTVPVIVLAPIFIIYLGFGLAPKVLTVMLMCFFPIVVSFADGMEQIDPNQINLIRSLGAGRLQEYLLVKVPGAASALFSGLKVAATYSISGAVVGEWLSSDKGLGYYMLRAKNGYMLDRVFACVLVVILLSLAMNGLVRLARLVLLPHERGGRRQAPEEV
ncbi:MAG: ABC transporter permease [Clostridiales bacterium]|nr:ABC transporter permease [Clostridiales bacterium]